MLTTCFVEGQLRFNMEPEYIQDAMYDFVSVNTPDGYLISAPAMETLQEELETILISYLARHLEKVMHTFDKENAEILETPVREYTVENDG